MHIVPGFRRQALLGLGIVMLILTLVLAACGANAGTGAGGSTGSSSTGSSPSTAPTSVKGYGAAYGCPSDAVVTSTPPAASKVVGPKDANVTITVASGAVVEVRLPFGQKWVGPTNGQKVLSTQDPSGYASKDTKTCVWRFVAKSSGTTQLDFSGMALCRGGKTCPMYVILVPFTIKVQ